MTETLETLDRPTLYASAKNKKFFEKGFILHCKRLIINKTVFPPPLASTFH